MSTIIIFGGGLQSLSLARGISNCNHRVICIADKHSPCKYSNYIDKFLEIDLKNYSVEKCLNDIKDTKATVIIPTEDEYAEWLSKNRHTIEHNSECLSAIVDNTLLSQVIDKSKLLEFCKKNDIPHPTTFKVTEENVDEAVQRVGFPSLIKPDISNGSRGIVPVNTIEELKEKLPKITKQYGNCSLQEYIHNPNHYYNCMMYRYKDGSFGQSVVTKITRFYPVKGGSSSFCTTIENTSIVKICSKLLNDLNWIGFADFDILEKDEGDYRIIEINPRVPASLHASYVSGINYGEIIVNDLLGLQKPSMKYKPGEQLRFLGLDIAWFLASPNRFSTNPSWFKFWGPHIHYQEGGLKDFKAMIYTIWRGILKQLSPSFRKAKSGMN